jgi:lysophospholipase L1-like esterase
MMQQNISSNYEESVKSISLDNNTELLISRSTRVKVYALSATPETFNIREASTGVTTTVAANAESQYFDGSAGLYIQKTGKQNLQVTVTEYQFASLTDETGIAGAQLVEPPLPFRSALTKTTPLWLQKLRKSVAKVISGTARSTWLSMGDSTEAGVTREASHPVLMAKLLKAMGVNTQAGMLWGAAYYGSMASMIAWDARIAAGAGWGLNSSVTLGGKFYQNATDLTALTLTPNEKFDRIEVWYYQNTGNATFTVDVGGAALQTVNSAGSMALVKVTVSTGAASAVQSINIKRTGVGATLYLIGVNTFDSTVPAIEIHQGGWATSTTADWVIDTSPFSPMKMYAQLAPELTFINLGVNDSNGGGLAGLGIFVTRYQSIIDKLKSLGSDIILCGFVQSDPGTYSSQATYDAYQEAIEKLAIDNGCAFLPFNAIIGSYAEANSNGYMVDQRHPGTLGMAAIARTKADLIRDWW